MGSEYLVFYNKTELSTGSDNSLITSNNVGIANTNPAHNLSVGANVYVDDTGANTIVTSGNVSAGYFIGDGSLLENLPGGSTPTLQAVSDTGNTTSNTIQFTNAGASLVTSGAVGVGLTAPTSDLHVAGNAHVTAEITAASNIFFTGLPSASKSDVLYYDSGTREVFFSTAPGAGSVTLQDVTDNGSNTTNTVQLEHATTALRITEDDSAITFNSNVVISSAGSAVRIAREAGAISQSTNAIGIGYRAGYTTQGSQSIAIGFQSGSNTQGIQAVAIGKDAGSNIQSDYAISIGQSAGNSAQGSYGVAIGQGAGTRGQGAAAVSIGFQAGNQAATQNTVSIGALSGWSGQGRAAVAIGDNAGYTRQGSYAVAVGRGAGYSTQPHRSIVMNATGSTFSPTTSDAFYVNPVRSATTSNVLYYNFTTKEISHGAAGAGSTPTLQAVSDTGNVTSNTIQFTNAGASLVTSGAIGVGLTNPTADLHVSGNVHVTDEITCVGDITGNTSDDRLKNRLSNLENALEKVAGLQGFRYEYNDLAKSFGLKNRGTRVGLSAQDVEKVLPEAVAQAPFSDQYLTLKYERVVPLLVEAIKELSQKVAFLENKILSNSS